MIDPAIIQEVLHREAQAMQTLEGADFPAIVAKVAADRDVDPDVLTEAVLEYATPGPC